MDVVVVGFLVLVAVVGAALALCLWQTPTVDETRCPSPWLLRDGGRCPGPCIWPGPQPCEPGPREEVREVGP